MVFSLEIKDIIDLNCTQMELEVFTSLCTTVQFVHLFFQLDLFLMIDFIWKLLLK